MNTTGLSSKNIVNSVNVFNDVVSINSKRRVYYSDE